MVFCDETGKKLLCMLRAYTSCEQSSEPRWFVKLKDKDYD